jgi:hypothetical protein
MWLESIRLGTDLGRDFDRDFDRGFAAVAALLL